MKRTVLLGLTLSLSATFLANDAQTNQPAHRWEKEIAAFERMDQTNLPPKNALLFTGSSTIRGWKTLQQDFPNHHLLNRGFGGSQIADVTHFANRLIFPYKPKAVYLRSGSNDIASGKTPDQVFADFTNFVATIHGKMPNVEITYISLSQSVARWGQADKEKALNQLVAEWVRGKPRLHYIETFASTLGPDGKPRPELFIADKLHFNDDGYKVLANAIRPHLPK